jgi:hypothetical protein
MKPTLSLICVYSFILFFLMISAACKTGKEPPPISKENKQETFMNPPVIIYKTRKDYSDKVPIGLSDDKMSVISYPDKIDIYHGGKFATPTLLVNGYLLDNRGIGINSAFTTYSYSEYSQLPATPTAETLFSQIIDNDPFIEIYFCKCSRDTVGLNRMIREGLTENCKKIK